MTDKITPIQPLSVPPIIKSPHEDSDEKKGKKEKQKQEPEQKNKDDDRPHHDLFDEYI